MRLLKLGLLFSTLVTNYAAFASSVFTIIPSIPSLTLRTDGHTVISYTVTNTSSAVLKDITIDPSYNTSARLRLRNTNCSILNPGASCQFNILIQGTQQPQKFSISPAVCAFNKTICSQPIAQNRVQVTLIKVLHPVTAYVGLSNNTLLPITLIENTVGHIEKSIPGFDFNEPAGVNVSLDGSNIYVTNTGTNEVFVIHAGSQKIAKRLPVGNVPSALSVDARGKLLYVVNYNNGQNEGSLSIINALSGALQSSITIGNGPWGIAQSPSGAYLYISNSYDNTVSVVNTIQKKLIRSIKVGKEPLGIVSAPNANWVYVANTRSNSVSVINTQSYEVTSIPLGGAKLPKGLAINPDGTKLFVGNWQEGSISVIDTKTNKVIKTISINAGPLGLAINPEGTQLYATLDQVNAVAVVDLRTHAVQYLYTEAPQVTMGNFIG